MELSRTSDALRSNYVGAVVACTLEFMGGIGACELNRVDILEQHHGTVWERGKRRQNILVGQCRIRKGDDINVEAENTCKGKR